MYLAPLHRIYLCAFIINRATESFLLTLGIKGPQWLEVRNVKVRNEHRSFCRHEFEVADCLHSIHVLDRTNIPPVKMLSLCLSTITQSFTNQTVVCAASASIYDNVLCNTSTPDINRKACRSCSVFDSSFVLS